MKKIFYGCLAVTILSGCGLFADEPLDIKGERVGVIRENRNLQPEYAAGQIKVKLPRASENMQWSQTGGNSAHLVGHIRAGGNLDEIWNTSFGEGSSKRNVLVATPIVADGLVFTVDAEGLVSAFSLQDGENIWEKELEPENEEAAEASISGGGIAFYDGKVFVTTGFGWVFALDAKDGKLLWQQDIGAPIRIAPTINDELVIIQTLDNGIYALKIADGSRLWKDKLEAESTIMIGGAAPAYSPEKDLVVAAFSNGQIQAYKASTGTPLWAEWLVPGSTTESIADITSVKASPVIDNDKVFAVGYNAPLVAIDIRTGVKLWQKEIAASSLPWVAGNFVFVLTNDGDLAALDKQNGKIIWSTIIPYAGGEEQVGIFTSGPVLANDALLVASSNGKLFSVSPYNGRILGVADVEEGIESTPIVAGETLLLTTKDAEIVAYR